MDVNWCNCVTGPVQHGSDGSRTTMVSRMNGPWMTSTLVNSVPTCAMDTDGVTMAIAGGTSLKACNYPLVAVCGIWYEIKAFFSPFPYRCDDGFSGTDCQPSTPLSSSVLADFESQDALMATWQEVIGGEVVPPDMGCGVVSSGSSLYFSKVRTLAMILSRNYGVSSNYFVSNHIFKYLIYKLFCFFSFL